MQQLGQRSKNRLHYERYDGVPLDEAYAKSYWSRLEALSNYPVLPKQGKRR